MVARSLRRLTRHLPPAAAVLVGTVVAAIVAGAPEWRLQAVVDALYLPVASPLGVLSRVVLALVAGSAVGVGAWAVLYLLLSNRVSLPKLKATAPAPKAVPVLRRADAHPDAPARRPIRAHADLGAPLPIARTAPPVAAPVPEEQPIPADLDLPLAAVDPASVPDVPREPVRPVAPLSRPAPEPVARIETFELTPIHRPAAPVQETASASLASLLDRLERGAAKREQRATPSLEETLAGLRKLAAG